MTTNISLREAIEAYKQTLVVSGKAPGTLYTYGKDFEQIQRFFGEERKLSSILKLHVGKFKRSDELLLLSNGQPRAPRTVKKTYRVLRMFFTWAQEESLIKSAPIPKGEPAFEAAGDE